MHVAIVAEEDAVRDAADTAREGAAIAGAPASGEEIVAVVHLGVARVRVVVPVAVQNAEMIAAPLSVEIMGVVVIVARLDGTIREVLAAPIAGIIARQAPTENGAPTARRDAKTVLTTRRSDDMAITIAAIDTPVSRSPLAREVAWKWRS